MKLHKKFGVYKYIYHLNNEELFLNFFKSMSFKQGNFANYVENGQKMIVRCSYSNLQKNCLAFFPKRSDPTLPRTLPLWMVQEI